MSHEQARLFTALKNGVVTRRGTFTDEELLCKDFPAPEWTLELDRHLPFPERVPDYGEHRRMAYPAIGDQLDAIWKALDRLAPNVPELAGLRAQIADVKTRYPKVK